MSVRYIVAVVRKDMGNGLYAHSLYKIKVIKAEKGFPTNISIVFPMSSPFKFSTFECFLRYIKKPKILVTSLLLTSTKDSYYLVKRKIDKFYILAAARKKYLKP